MVIYYSPVNLAFDLSLIAFYDFIYGSCLSCHKAKDYRNRMIGTCLNLLLKLKKWQKMIARCTIHSYGRSMLMSRITV